VTDDEAREVAADATGVYVAGRTFGTLPGQASAGFNDGFVRKYDAAGNELWTRQLGSSSDDDARGVSAAGGKVYVSGLAGAAMTGQTSSGFDDVFVSSYDAAGNQLWTLQFGSRDFEGARAVVAGPEAVNVAGDGVVYGPPFFGIGLPDTFVARVSVPSNDEPDCSAVTSSPDVLWPADHSLRLVTVAGASDPDGDPVTLAVTGVTQDEALNGLGDGDAAPDALRTHRADGILLRAERSGTGDARVYRVSYSATDPSGATCRGTAVVGVPLVRSKTVVDSRLEVDSLGGP
jgi:hypothetical protein